MAASISTAHTTSWLWGITSPPCPSRPKENCSRLWGLKRWNAGGGEGYGILGYHPDIDATTERSGFTAITYFLSLARAQFDTEKILKLLISAGANVDSLDRQEETPLFYACQNQHPEAVRLLSAAGVDMNAKNRYGQTAAEAARSMGARDKAELLETAMKQRKAQ
jgi:hypothetical protein